MADKRRNNGFDKGVRDPEEKARRGADIVRMRREKITWAEIAAKYEISEQRAAQIYKETLANHPLTALAVDEYRMEEQELIEVAVASLLKLALSDNPMITARTKVEAWNSLKGWSEHKSKLLGLNAPAKSEVVTISALDQQIAQLEAEMGLLPGEAPTHERSADAS